MQEIIQRFAEEGYLVDPQALDLIAASPDRRRLVETVMKNLDPSTVVVGVSDLEDSFRESEPVQCEVEKASMTGQASASKGLLPTDTVGEVDHHLHSSDCAPGEGNGRYLGRQNSAFAEGHKDLSGPRKSGSDASEPTKPDSPHETPTSHETPDPLSSSRPTSHKIPASCETLKPNQMPTSYRAPASHENSLIEKALRDKSARQGAESVAISTDSPIPNKVCIDAGFPADLDVLSDITGKSTCVGEYADFVKYFRDRYSKLREMLSTRLNARPIESLGENLTGREISIIGMVMEIRTSIKGNKVVQLEDPSGMIMVIFKKGTPPFEDAESLVSDEVIGVKGTTDGNGRVFANFLVRPDLQDRPLPTGEDGGALLMSDLHVGSKYFLEEAWQRFAVWINGETDDPLNLASRVKYIVIAGDLVDGVGVYPGQEGDLSIMDIREQYEAATELLNDIPDRIQIVVSPGNHDAVRQAEPQPALPESVRMLFKKNVSFVGNPAWFKLGGIDWLVYHGRSMDDLVLKIPGLSYNEPEKAMVEMLKRRHLSPIYGNRVSIAPEEEDLLVIQRPPAVLHCGHVHTFGVTRYKGVTVVNSGTWQGQTDFQKKMNIQPTAGIVPYLDLKTMRVRKLIFNST